MGNDNDAALAALRLALPELEEDLNILIECSSRLRAGPDGETEVVPETVEADAKEDVARKRAAVAAVRAVLGEEEEGQDAGRAD
jgi:hypothetical protein